MRFDICLNDKPLSELERTRGRENLRRRKRENSYEKKFTTFARENMGPDHLSRQLRSDYLRPAKRAPRFPKRRAVKTTCETVGLGPDPIEARRAVRQTSAQPGRAGSESGSLSRPVPACRGSAIGAAPTTNRRRSQPTAPAGRQHQKFSSRPDWQNSIKRNQEINAFLPGHLSSTETIAS